MALDFYSLDDPSKTHLLFQLFDNDLSNIESVLKKYQAKTGIFLDPYGTTRVYPTHIILIVDLLAEEIKTTRDNEGNLARIKGYFELGNNGLIADGD